MQMVRLILVVSCLLASVPTPAREVAGVDVPEQVRFPGIDEPLLLNGAGVREKFFIDVYVGALYLAVPVPAVQQLLTAPPANRVLMHFVYGRVSERMLNDAWRAGFAGNLDHAALAAVAGRLERFTGLFGDMHEGDRVWLDFVPGRGTAVHVNEALLDTIPGDDFNAALLAVWLGREPVSAALKKALIGDDKD